MNDQSRATAWHILKWAQELYIDNILIENVPEFRDWGPLGANGKPLKSKKGETFRAFINALRSLGYNVEDRILNAADYGDPTTRKRLFIIARRGGKPIAWPERSHSAQGGTSLFNSTKPYRTAREIIDWDLPSQSIFSRKKPLAPTTMARILAGLQRFNPHLEPFIVTLRRNVAARSVNEPVPTVSAQGNHLALTEFVLQQQSGGAPRSVDDPIPAIATKGAISFVEPVLVKVTHGEQDSGRPQTIDKPLPSLTTKNGIGLAEAFIIGHPRQKEHRDGTSIDSLDNPLRTVTATSSDMSLVEPVLIAIDQQSSGDSAIRSVDEPTPTIVTKARLAVAEPCIVKYYGNESSAESLNEPLDTVTTKDRFALVQPELDGYRLDIRFRMLQPHELAQAQGFPSDYPFTGNKSEITKQIGNAVPVNLARSLCTALLADFKPKRRSTPIPIATLPIVEARA